MTQRIMEGNDLHTGTVSEAQYLCSDSKHELWKIRGRTEVSQRLLLRVTIISVKDADEPTLRASSEHCAVSCAMFACVKIQTTAGRARGIPSYVCGMLYDVCHTYAGCLLLLLLCVRILACVRCCVLCVLCVRVWVGEVCCGGGGVYVMCVLAQRDGRGRHVICALLRVSCMLCCVVWYVVCVMCCECVTTRVVHVACFQNFAENMSMTFRKKSKHVKAHHDTPQNNENIPLNTRSTQRHRTTPLQYRCRKTENTKTTNTAYHIQAPTYVDPVPMT